MIAMTMAGRIAEEVVSEDISTGAAGDIQQATQMARAMVMQWGMSDKLGMVQYGDNDEYVFLGREMARAKDYSENTAQEIDAEVKRIIDEAYKVANDMIVDESRQAGIDRQRVAGIRDVGRRAGGGDCRAPARSRRRRRRRVRNRPWARPPARRCRNRPASRPRRSCQDWAPLLRHRCNWCRPASQSTLPRRLVRVGR